MSWGDAQVGGDGAVTLHRTSGELLALATRRSLGPGCWSPPLSVSAGDAASTWAQPTLRQGSRPGGPIRMAAPLRQAPPPGAHDRKRPLRRVCRPASGSPITTRRRPRAEARSIAISNAAVRGALHPRGPPRREPALRAPAPGAASGHAVAGARVTAVKRGQQPHGLGGEQRGGCGAAGSDEHRPPAVFVTVRPAIAVEPARDRLARDDFFQPRACASLSRSARATH